MIEEATPTSSSRLRQLRALMAPLAANRGSVAASESHLRVARELCDALLHQEAHGGLTRSELLAQVTPDLRDLADARIDVFLELGLLQTYILKRHQQRYVLNMAGYIGLMVAERIGERGGVEELLRLLHRTRQEIEAGHIDEETVAERLREARKVFIGFANELRRRLATDTLRELASYTREHDSTEAFSEVVNLARLVGERFALQSEWAAALIRAAQLYTRELEQVTRKLIEEGASTRDFSFLDPSDYDEAARSASLAALEEVGASLIFDLGTAPVAPWQITGALSNYRPKTLTRRRPHEPAPSTDPDPLALYARMRSEAQARTERDAELFLQGADSVELTDRLRATDWRGVRQTLGRFLTIHHHSPRRFHVDLRDSVLVDPSTEATYFSPASLDRLDQQAERDEESATASIEEEVA